MADDAKPPTPADCRYCPSGTCAVPYGTCHCGCGRQTSRITSSNHSRSAELRGAPRKFLKGHQLRKLTNGQYDLILDRLDAGIGHKEIAAEFGVSQVTISKIAIKFGRRRQNWSAKWLTETDITEILALYDQGEKIKDIAAKFDMVPNNVSRIANAHGRRRNKVRSDRKRPL